MNKWIPLFEAASQDLDAEAPLLRNTPGQIQALIAPHKETGYKLSPEAHLAMGWWFYTVYGREWFIGCIAGHVRQKGSCNANPHDILEFVQERLRVQGCKTRLRLPGNPSIMMRYWSWLMR